MELIRKIIHVDMDAFYASIEQRDHPEWRGKPLVVGGDPNRRGVVATCSYEARRYGIHSAMAAQQAYQRCPHAIFIRPRFDVYHAVSAQIMQIFHSYTELVEPLSLDEAYLDVTHNLRGIAAGTHVAQAIKAQIYQETGLTASAGVSYNKFIAKLASDYRKPDGLTVVSPQQAVRFLEGISIDKFFGVGKVTAARLRELDIETGADLKRLSEAELQRILHKQGSVLYHYVRGEDDRPVQPARVRKSVGKETTLSEDLDDPEELLLLMSQMAEQVARRLHELQLLGKTITLKLRWSDFQRLTRSITIPDATQDARTIVNILTPVLLNQMQTGQQRVRLIGVTVSHLITSAEANQPAQIYPLPLWDEDAWLA
ncbi:DNA polymerase IV [Dictyobacter arantiisoli]|uniref:DNA polymerase IV n=1 Tax=Dictyobacter arantiisoli TaxID=2014874 RepID=A0A5A5TCK4_9CHLR|nr:DNA polymerase IV [Dictyobacter arantiisoli]GCF08763.1 DNA polymerase IV [Dictyobacter arantiisoli]